MLLIILALFWVALLAPIVVRRLRDGGTEKSIQSFHNEHEVLSRQDYAVEPANRLARPGESLVTAQSGGHKPRLAVVHENDTYQTLESKSTWDEWSEDYDYDDAQRPGATQPNRYAKAYSSRPSRPTQPAVTQRYQPPIRRRTMKAQRRMFFFRLIMVALVLTLIAYVSGMSLLVDVAALAWLGVVAYIALAFYAVSQGFLNDSSLPLHLPKRPEFAAVKSMYDENDERYVPRYEQEFTSEFYEPEADEQWQHQSLRRRALG
jgi:hypothetical protein